MKRDIYKSKKTKRKEMFSWIILLVVVFALVSPFIYRKFLVTDSVTETRELLIVSKNAPVSADSGYNTKERHNSSANKSEVTYYVRVDTSELDCGEDTMDVDVSSSVYQEVETGTYHKFTVVTDSLVTGQKRVSVYY